MGILIFFPIVVFAASSIGSTAGLTIPAESIPKPYVIEIQNFKGEKVSEAKGLSLSTDEFGIAKDLGANPHTEDRFQTLPDISWGMGSRIILKRAPVFNLVDGKKKLELRSWSTTVGDLFAEKNIELGKDDKSTPDLSADLSDGLLIKILRVAKTTVVENRSITFNTIKKEDPNMDKGKTKTTQKGVAGIKAFAYEVRREDGEEVSRRLLKTEVTKEPVAEIIMIGTKPVITVSCRFNDTVIDAALKYRVDANELCTRMMKESRGNPNSDGGNYKGLFQYESGFWADASKKAGYSGASIWDAKAQIYTTAWAWSHGLRGRWPS